MMSTSVATTSSNRYKKNDNIFVNIGKQSHPATFLEYDNENNNKARIRFTASSTVDTVELNQLELMDTTIKRHRTPKHTSKDTAVDVPTVTKKRRAQPGTAAKSTDAHFAMMFANRQLEMGITNEKCPTGTVAMGTTGNAVTVANVTTQKHHTPTITKHTAANIAGATSAVVHNAPVASPVLITTSSYTEHPTGNVVNHTTVATTTTTSTLMPDKTTPLNNFTTYNGGRYRLSNHGNHYNRWICNKFLMEHKSDKPSNIYYDKSEIQKMKRDKSSFNAEDWTFTRCSGTFNVYLNGKIEFITPHDCSSTFQINDAIDDRPMIMTMMPSSNFGLSSKLSLNMIRHSVMNTPGIWKSVFGGYNERFHTPNLEDFPDLNTKVTQYMSWYVTSVQQLYPTLIYVKYSILLSKPNAPAQKFHFDYQDSVMNKDPKRQPISLIVAIDPFSLNIVKEREGNNTTVIVKHIEEGNCIFFTNKVEHGGAKNEHQRIGKPAEAIRLFAYMVSDEKYNTSQRTTGNNQARRNNLLSI